MSISTDTRFESMRRINKNKMYSLIISALKSANEDGLTARECALQLYNEGKIFDYNRQMTAPRLTELVDKGVVELIGKKFDDLTGRMVGVYALAS